MPGPQAGMRVGPYELLSPAGSGAMGMVWRATDTRLHRTVAIKFAREQFSEQVQNEARCIAQLNHPHICTIYDVGENYIVMEFLQGKAIAGPLPVDQVLLYGMQIADALEAAHSNGIIHRDLKPSNIIATKAGIKLLDFGVAVQRVSGTDPDATILENAAVSTFAGTPLYMAPEQCRGELADQRSDIFAFGAVLFEMITGKEAFEFHDRNGRSSAWPAQKLDPAPLANIGLIDIVRTCLEDNPDLRWQSARELKHALGWIREMQSSTQGDRVPTRTWMKQLAITIPLVIAAVAITLWLKPSNPEPPQIRTITYSGRDFSPAISPDGRVVAFSSDRDGAPKIWLKQLDGGGEVALTSGADDNPRFSPDGNTILFTHAEPSHMSLYKMASLGGDTRKLIDNAIAGDFSPDGRRITFVRWNDQQNPEESSIWTAAADGTDEAEVARFPNVHLDRPRWSPSGASIAAVGSPAVQGGLYLQTWLVGADGKNPRQLRALGIQRGISSLGWANNYTLIYSRGDRNIPVNARLTLHDVRRDVVVRSLPWPCCALGLDVAGTGTVIFDEQATRSGLLKVGPVGTDEVWLSRANSCDRQPVLSPDGRTVLFTSNRGGTNMNLWEMQLATGAIRRVTEDDAIDNDPAFSADGKRLLFSSDRSGVFEIYIANRDGSEARQITHDGVDAENATMTRDGKWVVYASAHPQKLGIWKIHPDGSGAIRLVKGIVSNPEVSPDGVYVAYITSVQPEWAAIKIARVADGSEIPFQIRCPIRKQNNIIIGRVRWIAASQNGAADSLAYIGQDENGATGVFIQAFAPGTQKTTARKQLRRFDFRMPVESLGISPDGKTFVVSVADDTTSVMLAKGVPGLNARR